MQATQLLDKIDFKKSGGLVPAIVQDARTRVVLMLGYMNREAVAKSISSGFVTFYSRTRNKLWVKGEESGNTLHFQSASLDCDNDTLLVLAIPTGPVCHTGAATCFADKNDIDVNAVIPDSHTDASSTKIDSHKDSFHFLSELETLISSRKQEDPNTSYTASLFKGGALKMAQKVGEEAVEVILDAVTNNRERTVQEAADLVYHLLVLLASMDLSLTDVVQVLRERNKIAK